MILYYDGTLCGFFCLLGHALKERLQVTEIRHRQQPATIALFDRERIIDSDPVWAEKVARGLRNRFGDRFMRLLGQALLSEEAAIEQDLLVLTQRALRAGAKILGNRADPLVHRVVSCARKTARERHRLSGLLRFRRLADDSYLACCSPRCNVAALLGPHFAARLADMRWVIVDEKRRIGVFGIGHDWEVFEQVNISPPLRLHDDEPQIAELWCVFHQEVSNRQRFNPQLQRQFMPKKYWRFLTEMQAGKNVAGGVESAVSFRLPTR